MISLPETTALYERIKARGAAAPQNLPQQPVPFLGRQRELDEITGLLANPACRLLTLLGSGGVGKTRLTIKAAVQPGLYQRQVPIIAEINREFENLWTGWQWAIVKGAIEDVETYVAGLTPFLEYQSRFQEMVTLLQDALKRLRMLGPGQIEIRWEEFLRASWERQLGEVYFRLGRLSEREPHHLRALALLGKAMPAKPVSLVASLGCHLCQQVWCRLWPARISTRQVAEKFDRGQEVGNALRSRFGSRPH